MSYFKTRDNCSLYYETIGFESYRPVVVFLNGTLQTTLYWKTIAAKIKPFFRSLLYDARGQGESELGGLPLSLDLHVDDLYALLHHLDVSKAHLVGLSHGAYVAYALAAKYAWIADKMVMCSAGAGSTYRTRLIVKSWKKILEHGGLEAMVWSTIVHVLGEPYLRQNEKILDRMVKTIVRRNKKESLMAHFKAMESYAPISRVLKKIESPLLVLSGDKDPLIRQQGCAVIAKKCGGRHMVFKGVGHSMGVEAPELFVKTLLQFLSGG